MIMPSTHDTPPPQADLRIVTPHVQDVPTAEPAEAQIIGIIMKNPDALEEALRLRLEAKHFYVKWRPAWTAVEEMLDGDEGYPSSDALQVKLQSMGEPDLAAELEHLVYHGETYMENIGFYVNTVMKAWRDRTLDAKAQKLALLTRTGGATLEEYQELLQGMQEALVAATGAQDDLFKHASVEELEDMPAPDYLVHGVIVEKTDHIVVAPTQAGKSTVALDLALCVASGNYWHGRKVRQADVVYIAAEGATGLPKRVRAWRIHNGVSIDEVQDHFHAILQPVNLLSDDEVCRLERTIDAMVGDHDVGAIVIDTLSRCTAAGGDVNLERDAGRAMLAIQRLRDRYGCASVTLAHPGHEGERIRASSVFPQWTDMIYTIKLENSSTDHLAADSVITIDSNKTKEDGRPDTIRLVARLESWPDGETGRSLSALVLESADSIPEVKRPRAALTPSQVAVMECLQHATSPIRGPEVITYCEPKGIKRSTAYSALEWVVQQKYATQSSNGQYAVTQKGSALDLG